jgi:phosphatidylserine/phosphatidylglycerophosphate/cardiolipin synthase-like enzyme
MRLLIQPDDGLRLVLKGIAGAKRTIHIAIFRFDHKEVERALAAAVGRGVAVHALIAHTNRAGEQSLRKLELRLLAAGVTVARTAGDLDRYHGKFMVVDGRELYILAFNWTHLDTERSRSFAIITSVRSLVKEAERLFEADTKRNTYEPGAGRLVVSPVNARRLLADFIKGAKKELVIYDLKVSDRAMLGLLEQRSKAGVKIRAIGRITKKVSGAQVRKPPMRLHARAMVRDGSFVFIGSQSLRTNELDSRREVGVILRDAKIASRVLQTFEQDWSSGHETEPDKAIEAPVDAIAKRVAKALAKELPEAAPVLNGVVEEVVGAEAEIELKPEKVEAVVKDAVKEAVKEAVSSLVQDAAGGK